MQKPEESSTCQIDNMTNFGDDEIMKQHSDIRSAEAEKIPFVADKARVDLQLFFCVHAYDISLLAF